MLGYVLVMFRLCTAAATGPAGGLGYGYVLLLFWLCLGYILQQVGCVLVMIRLCSGNVPQLLQVLLVGYVRLCSRLDYVLVIYCSCRRWVMFWLYVWVMYCSWRSSCWLVVLGYVMVMFRLCSGHVRVMFWSCTAAAAGPAGVGVSL